MAYWCHANSTGVPYVYLPTSEATQHYEQAIAFHLTETPCLAEGRAPIACVSRRFQPSKGAKYGYESGTCPGDADGAPFPSTFQVAGQPVLDPTVRSARHDVGPHAPTRRAAAGRQAIHSRQS